MAILFVSDVHLSGDRPGRVSAFLSFLDGPARQADALYILGDLFDQWLGDDDDSPLHASIMEALRALTACNVPVHVMHGNHDFLLGPSFAEKTGCRLLCDPSTIELYGTPALLMHGDSLCTDDAQYQAWRAYTRDPKNQEQFVALPLDVRMARAADIRQVSRELSRLKPEDIMDVNADAVRAAMETHRVRYLIHGHTHRPGIHDMEVGGKAARRIVLGDWYDHDSVLFWNEDGYRLETAGV